MTGAPLFDWPDRAKARPVLTLDLARTFGWCAGVPGCAQPTYGAVRLEGRAPGIIFADLARWLHVLVRQHQPSEILLEAPLGAAGASAARLAYGLDAHVHLLAHQLGVAVREEPVWRTRREILGRSDFPAGSAKSEVVAWCRAQGYAPTDDNAADALLLWHHAERQRFGRKAA